MIHHEQFTHWFLQKAKYTNCLQEIIQIVMERRWGICGVHIGVKRVNIRLDQGWFPQLRVNIEVSEAYPVV